MSSSSAYAVLVTMMLQLSDKQFDLTSRECVFLEIWVSSYSELALIIASLDHDTSHENQRLWEELIVRSR